MKSIKKYLDNQGTERNQDKAMAKNNNLVYNY